MANGQTGTGKTNTLGRLGDEDTSARGIMVRAVEDILANISPETDSISVSFLQFFLEEANQEVIMAQGGICLLAMTATDAEDPQTLRMVAGAIANLCGNDKLQMRLRSEGGIKALLGMVRCRHPDVLSQVARSRHGRSLLIDDGALPWIVQNANSEASLIRRHVELALCHLAQHEINAKDMISGGALWELVRISRDCSRAEL
ncbi:hypothetical protein SASPL_135473 [Salvia splendens]|uniref:Uncharacterized protein n=1 Tax=Salvia splendens TaxID=180675 RepID=A0A8X8ZFR4_SALSN|nr:hypothetical protein SASPL_135473 [Salvia splendens]